MIATIQKAIPRAVPIALLLGLAIHVTRCATEIAADKEVGRVIAIADSLKAQRDSLVAVADSLKPLADSIITVQSVKTVYVRQAIEALPPAETPSDSARDRIIATQDTIITDLNVAIGKMREAEASLRGALSLSDERGDSLQAFILRPKKKPSRVALAVFGGECVYAGGAGPCIGVGVSYRIF